MHMLQQIFNPLPPNGFAWTCIAKILFVKKEGIMEKNSHERRVYESVCNGGLF